MEKIDVVSVKPEISFKEFEKIDIRYSKRWLFYINSSNWADQPMREQEQIMDIQIWI